MVDREFQKEKERLENMPLPALFCIIIRETVLTPIWRRVKTVP